MKNNIYIYIIIMAVVTYTIRALPITLIRKEIKNRNIAKKRKLLNNILLLPMDKIGLRYPINSF